MIEPCLPVLVVIIAEFDTVWEVIDTLCEFFSLKINVGHNAQ